MDAKLSIDADAQDANSSQEPSRTFPKSVRLTKRKHFQRLAHGCKRIHGQLFVIEYRKNKFPFSRIGITASRRYGKAHERNRFKRIVREAFRLCRDRFPAGLDINVKPLDTAKQASRDDMMNEFLQLALKVTT